MDSVIRILMKWEITSAFLLSILFQHTNTASDMTYPWMSPRPDNGSGGVRAGAVLKRLS